MTSLQRKLRRSRLGANKPKAQEQPYQLMPDGSFRIYHATRGFKRICAARMHLYFGGN